MCSSVKDVHNICTISVAAERSNIAVNASALFVSSSVTTTASLSVARPAAALTGAGGDGRSLHFLSVPWPQPQHICLLRAPLPPSLVHNICCSSKIQHFHYGFCLVCQFHNNHRIFFCCLPRYRPHWCRRWLAIFLFHICCEPIGLQCRHRTVRS